MTPPARRRRSRRRATFISATRVRALPPRPSGTRGARSLGEGGGPPVGPACRLFDPLARPAVTSVHLVHVSTTCPDG